MVDRKTLNSVIDFVQPLLVGDHFECLDAEWDADEQVLRLFVDRTGEGAMDMDDCVQVTRKLLDIPELDEMIEGPYSLEVSSPGVNRPIRLREHFLAAVDQMIEAKLLDQVDGRKHGKGRLVAVEDDGLVTVETKRGPWSFPLEKLNHASVVYDWDRENIGD